MRDEFFATPYRGPVDDPKLAHEAEVAVEAVEAELLGRRVAAGVCECIFVCRRKLVVEDPPDAVLALLTLALD